MHAALVEAIGVSVVVRVGANLRNYSTRDTKAASDVRHGHDIILFCSPSPLLILVRCGNRVVGYSLECL